MPDCEVVPMSVKFFRNDRLLCMFDPETFKMYLYRDGRWIESEDPAIREDIRLRRSNSAVRGTWTRLRLRARNPAQSGSRLSSKPLCGSIPFTCEKARSFSSSESRLPLCYSRHERLLSVKFAAADGQPHVGRGLDHYAGLGCRSVMVAASPSAIFRWAVNDSSPEISN